MIFEPPFRILVVDDLPDNLVLLDVLLSAEGYAVELASSGELALQTIQAAPPDLVLLDVMMPGMDGLEVTRRIRQQSQLQHLPILLITAHDEASVNQGLSLGANGLIRKPLDFDQLLNQIRRLVSVKAQH